MSEKVSFKFTPMTAAIVGLVIGILATGAVAYAVWGVPYVTNPGTQLGTLKAGFIYVGPIGDYGWSHAHEQGRLYIEGKYPWLTTVYLESVAEEDCETAIDYLIQTQGCDVVFTTSFGFMDATIAAGAKYPDKIFFHCSGYLRSANVGTYFADFYQLYYLNGLMAGALTMNGKIGYVAAFPLPELIRHINAYHLGAQEVNATVETHVRWLLTDWYDPVAARTAAENLIAAGCDILAYTEDSTAVLDVAEENPGVYAFSHYSPMQSFAPTSCISGQLVRWDLMYEDIIQKIYLGQYTSTNLVNVDLHWLLQEGGVELGGEFGVPINPLFEADLRAIMTTDTKTGLGSISVYDLVFNRTEQMSDVNIIFDPYTGEIRDQADTVMIADGVRASYYYLLTIDWFVLGVIGDPSP
ncbi:MAG: BMP family ABC transporter substrate-binding protein [Candidatus Hodarchaeota archaeon]